MNSIQFYTRRIFFECDYEEKGQTQEIILNKYLTYLMQNFNNFSSYNRKKMTTSAVSHASSSLTQIVSELHAKQTEAQATLAKVNEEMAQFLTAQENATGANKATFEQCNERLSTLSAASKELDRCAGAHFDAQQRLRQEKTNAACSTILRQNSPATDATTGATSTSSSSTVHLRLYLDGNPSSRLSLIAASSNPGTRLNLLPNTTSTNSSSPAPLRLNPEGNSSGRLSLIAAPSNPGATLSLLPSTTTTTSTGPLRLNPDGNSSGTS
jgi:myosin heavy subunit